MKRNRLTPAAIDSSSKALVPRRLLDLHSDSGSSMLPALREREQRDEMTVFNPCQRAAHGRLIIEIAILRKSDARCCTDGDCG
jgi:hypothetical protein